MLCYRPDSRYWCPASGVALESRGQQIGNPFVHLRGEDWSRMHWQPNILARAPDVVGQPDGHRRGARRATLAQALVWHHAIVETAQQPDLPPVAGATPRQTSGAAAQGG